MKINRLFTAAAVTAIVIATCATRNCIAQTNGSSGNCQGIWKGMMLSSGSAGSATLETDISQKGASLTGAGRVTQGLVTNGGALAGTVSPTSKIGISINLGTVGNLSATINLHGNVGTGTYILANQSGSFRDKGSLALTLESGLTTPNVSGLYVATQLSDSSGSQLTGCTFYLLQTGNSLYVSTLWNGNYIYNGTGTIIGNTITFQLTQASKIVGPPNMISGSATISSGTLTGVSFMGSPTNTNTSAIAFSAPFAMALL